MITTIKSGHSGEIFIQILCSVFIMLNEVITFSTTVSSKQAGVMSWFHIDDHAVLILKKNKTFVFTHANISRTNYRN